MFLQGARQSLCFQFPRQLSQGLGTLTAFSPSPCTDNNACVLLENPPISLSYLSIIPSKTSPHSFNFIQLCSSQHWDISSQSRTYFRTQASLRQPTFVFIANSVSINAFAIEATPSLTFCPLRVGTSEKLETNNHNPLHQSSWVNVRCVVAIYLRILY